MLKTLSHLILTTISIFKRQKKHLEKLENKNKHKYCQTCGLLLLSTASRDAKWHNPLRKRLAVIKSEIINLSNVPFIQNLGIYNRKKKHKDLCKWL